MEAHNAGELLSWSHPSSPLASVLPLSADVGSDSHVLRVVAKAVDERGGFLLFHADLVDGSKERKPGKQK